MRFPDEIFCVLLLSFRPRFHYEISCFLTQGGQEEGQEGDKKRTRRGQEGEFIFCEFMYFAIVRFPYEI